MTGVFVNKAYWGDGIFVTTEGSPAHKLTQDALKQVGTCLKDLKIQESL